MIAAALLALAAQADESAHYALDYLTPPAGVVIEAGGLAFLDERTLAVSTRRGEVWLVEDALAADPAAARFRRFAEGLHEGLGLAVIDGKLVVLQRGELSRLVDTDGDGRCDRVEVLASGWGLSGNYHEFAFGLPRDAAGDHYLGLNLGFFDPEWWHGQARARWRGWVLRCAPDGTLTPFASGFRSPCGLALDLEGRLLVTDNQGDWIASSPIHHVREGGFHGHPASLDWDPELRSTGFAHSDTAPATERERTPPAIWIPYDWSRSTGNLVADDTRGRFGPFAGQLFVAELTLGRVLRAQLEEVQGVTQGAVFPFRQRVGAACRVAFAPDGTLFAGLTNRGWGGLAPNDGIARLRYTGVAPFEIERVRVLRDGFALRFTADLPERLDLGAIQASCRQYDYEWWWEYGSPEKRSVQRAALLESVPGSRRELVLRVAGLAPAMCARVRIAGLADASGRPLLHDEFAYTVNQLPDAPRSTLHVAKVAVPPTDRQSPNEGWLWLTWADPFDSFVPTDAWVLRDIELDRADPRRFAFAEGNGALVNVGPGEPRHFASRYEMGDGEWRVSFQLPAGGRTGLLIQGRYELVLDDSPQCGRVDGGPLPSSAAYRGPGEWHELEVAFRAPRFEGGLRTEPARIERAELDGQLVLEGVVLDGPTPGAVLPGEAPLGPLVLRGDAGLAALRGLSLRAALGDAEGRSPLFDGAGLTGFASSGAAEWRVEGGELVGSGGAGELRGPVLDEAAAALLLEARISPGGRAFLALVSDSGREHAAVLDSDSGSAERTGSLAGRAPVRAQLVEPGVWFELELRAERAEGGLLLTSRLNGVAVARHLEALGAPGEARVVLRLAEGSELRVRRLESR